MNRFLNNKYILGVGYAAIWVLLFFCFEQLVSDVMWSINEKWLGDCNQVAGGILILLLYGYIVYLLYGKYKRCLFSSLLIGLILFVLVIYTYYRFVSSTFNFWRIVDGFDIAYTDGLFIVVLCAICHQIKQNRHVDKNSKDAPKSILLPDRPIGENDKDLLGYRSIVSSLIRDINGLQLDEGSYSIGITGEWGIGKSSFFYLFKKDLDSDKAIIYEFNPRTSAKLEDIQQDFFNGFANKLAPYHTGVQRKFRLYQEALQILNDGILSKFLSKLSFGKDEVSREDINEIIQEVGKRIYVLIDDLDRLTGEELIEVMKIIDRNAGFINTVFITAYDKQYVNEVLNNYLGISSKTDFTDKYFSYELSLPVQKTEDLNQCATEIIKNSLLFTDDDALGQKEMLDQWEKVNSQILKSLRTLRHVKRWVNILLSRYKEVKNDVVFSDFALLTLLRYKDISVYNALAEGHFLKKGDLFNDNTGKAFYLKDYDDDLKAIAKWDSSIDILKSLFVEMPSNDYQIGDKYQRLQYVNSFHNYFYDYKPGEIYYKDLMQLYRTEDDTKVVEVLKELIGYDKEENTYVSGRYESVEDFLLLRKVSQLSSQKDVERQLLLLLELLKIVGRQITMEGRIMYYLTEDMAKECSAADLYGNEEHYRIEIGPVIDAMCIKFPYYMGLVMLQVNTGINDDNGDESNLMFHQNDIVKWCEKCQEGVISHGGDLGTIVMFSRILPSKDAEQATSVAQENFISYINSHSKAFSENLLKVSRTHATRPHMIVSIREGYTGKTFFPYKDVSLEDWIQKHVDQKYLKSILLRLFYSQDYKLEIELQKGEWSGKEKDYDGIWRVIVRADEDQQEQQVMPAINNRVALSIEIIAKETSLDKETVKATIQRLVKKGVLNETYNNLAETIAKFEEGDFVRMKNDVYEKVNQSGQYTQNVYRIKEIKQGIVMLENVQKGYAFREIEAIPIDGKHDVNIYEQVYPAASYVGEGENVPAFHADDSYYMLQFMHRSYEGKTFVEYVKEKNLHFVHEVQHWLRDEFGEDHLKVRDYA